MELVPKLTLTLQERLLLANQLRILQCLEPNKEDYKTHIEIIENGYEYLYDRLANALQDPPERDVAPEVHAVFNMFRALSGSIRDLSDKAGIDLKRAHFLGYDGNDESSHYHYATFVIERMGLYSESKRADGNYNTHPEMLPRYRRMLERWHSLGDRYELTRDEILQVVGTQGRQ